MTVRLPNVRGISRSDAGDELPRNIEKRQAAAPKTPKNEWIILRLADKQWETEAAQWRKSQSNLWDPWST